MGWIEDMMKDVARRAASRSYPPGVIVQSSVVSGGGQGIVQCTMNGRRVCTGPGYVIVEHTYWLTPYSHDITVDRTGMVYAGGEPLTGGLPVPGYRPGGGFSVRLSNGRLAINGHPIPGYIPPPGAAECSVEQFGNR